MKEDEIMHNENKINERQNEILAAQYEKEIVKKGSLALLGFNAVFAGALIISTMYTLVQFGEGLLSVIGN